MQKHNWVSRFASFFLSRKQVSIVLFLLLTTIGTGALFSLRREGFPQVPVKMVVISTVYKGAASSEVEQSVTNPIESAIKDLKEVKSTSSTSSESHSTVIVTLDEKSAVDASLQDITTKVSGASLPKDADKPNIMQPATGGSAFVFGLTGDFTPEQLYDQGRIFQREVASVKGVKQVTLASNYTDRVTVLFDPVKIANSGVDISKIQSVLTANNLNFPAGQNLTIDGSRATLLVAGRYSLLDDLQSTKLPTITGSLINLSDVATIDRGIDQAGQVNDIGILHNDKMKSSLGIVYNVDIRADSDIINVNNTLTTTLDNLKSNNTLSHNLQITRLVDGAASTNQQIDEIKAGAIGEKWDNLGAFGYVGYIFGGIWLLMIAMFLFVNLRTALIAGAAIPLSFLFTLIALWATGVTLNTLTLFSMVLVLGLVVDPAIVVLESIQRYKDMGRSGIDGVAAAVNSIGQGLLMATICSIIVFTPFGIVSGVFGEIIKFIPITVIPALIASFFVPLIFLAPLAGKFIKARKLDPSVPHDEEHTLWAVSRWFKRANLFVLRRVWLQIVIILLAATVPLGVTGYLFASGSVKSAQFSKPKDTTEALATVSYPASMTDTQMEDLAQKAETVLNRHSEIANYYFMSQSATSFSLYMNLTPIKDRNIVANDLMKTIKSELPRDPVRQIYSSADTLSSGPPAAEFPVQLQIHDNDLTKLKTFALAVGKYAGTLAGVERVSDGYTDGGTGSVKITLTKEATASGLNTATVGAQLSSILGEQPLTKLAIDDQQIDVVAKYSGVDKYNSLDALKNAMISTAKGSVKLGDVAVLTTEAATGSISHQDGQRYAMVKAGLSSTANASDVQKKVNDWAKDHLKQYGLRSDALESKGEGDDIAASFVNLFEALGIAILMIYFVLALFFGSFLRPIIITFALPLSFVGVFPVLALLGNEFGFLEILGLITLAGIVVNVGIFVIDYANHKVANGMAVDEAIAQATAVRFRPIFLTKVTALGSLLPLAILSPFWRGLASVIIAGILTSGILSLFTTPILYSWSVKLARFPAWIRRRFGRHGSGLSSSDQNFEMAHVQPRCPEIVHNIQSLQDIKPTHKHTDN
jgi:HAE1 family hydrophobic/amphiphilic exporter-1